MRYIQNILIALGLIVFFSCQQNAEKEAMSRLASVIGSKSHYENEFIRRIELHKELLAECTSNDEKWIITRKLYNEYFCYDIDSAIVYSNRMSSLADNPEKGMMALEAHTSCLCALRRYKDALELINSVDTACLNELQKYAYYNAHIALYTSLGNEPDAKKEHIHSRYHYQKLLSRLPGIPPRERKYINGKQLMLEGRFDEALDSLFAVLEMKNDISSTLHTTYAIANCYKAKGNRSNYKRWLAETAIYDIQRPNKQYKSLYDLALCLHEDGDYSKAGKFINLTMTDAISCKHDTRIINAASAQMIINKAADENIRSRRWLWISLIVILLVTIAVISVSLAKVNRQRRRLKELMRRTKELNIELSNKNIIIAEANTIKEKYMFKYMYLSANFIKEMDEYRKELRHTYKEKGADALLSKLREPEYIYMQYKTVYQLFDEIFLGIFPNFVEKVNELLKKDKRIVIKHAGIMPTELRILAVIRLGITESRKIAEFLNTSVNTIYTYRTKMRYDSIHGPELFEEKIKNINSNPL